MNRMSFALVAALLTACGPGLAPPTGNNGGPVLNENLFPTGSEEEQMLAEARAYQHLEDTNRLIGVGELFTEKIEIDALSTAHVKIRQMVDGVPVLGGTTVVHMKPNGTVNTFTDELKRDIDTIDASTFDYGADDILDLAVDATGGWDDVTNVPEPTLVVMRHEGEDRLVWIVNIERLEGSERTGMPLVFMDAKSGEFVFQYDNLQTIDGSADTDYNGSITFPVTQVGSRYELRGEGVGTYSFDNAEPFWSSVNASHLDQVTSSSTTFTGDDVAVDAHYGASKTVQYLAENHGRDGINGSGGPTLKDSNITSGVHYGTNYNNAFWNGRTMVYGDGDGSRFSALTSLDIAAHEMGHGLTEFTAGLVYRNESGALNEAFSDILGARVEAWVNGEGPNVWKIGEDCYTPFNGNSDALRYMSDPAADGSSREHYSTRYTGSQDNGGVHWNSGIANLAFFLAAEGGEHPNSAHDGIDVTGIGIVKSYDIYYRALTVYMSANTTFAGARQATLNSANDLYGSGSQEYASIARSWAAVGVGQPIANPDDPVNEPVPPTPPMDGEGNENGLSAASGSWNRYAVEVPIGATELRVEIQGGTGDADLYVHSSEPSDTAYTCRPYKSGNVEECVIADPSAGTWHIGVKAYSAYTGVDLATTITGGASAPEFLDLDNLNGSQGDFQYFAVDVPAGSENLNFVMTGGTGDADMYLRYGSDPTTSEYDCRPYKGGNEEACSYEDPAAGTYHVMIRGYSDFSGVSVDGTWD